MQIYMKNGKALWMNEKAITPKKTAAGETWVLNETLKTGNIKGAISFTSNGTRYSQITVMPLSKSRLKYDSTIVYKTNEWINQAYRKLTFDAPTTGALLQWLQANGTKQ